MAVAVKKVGFLCLPDEQLDLFSAVTRLPGFRPEVVIDSNVSTCAFKMAEILQIPTSTDLAVLRRFPCDLVIIPAGRPDLKLDVTAAMDGYPTQVLTPAEAAAEIGVELDGDCESALPAPRSWTLPLAVRSARGAGDDPTSDSDDELVIQVEEPFQIERHPFENRVDEAPFARSLPDDDEDGPAETPTEIDSVIETLNLACDKQRLLKRILEIAVRTAGGDSGSIMLLDETGENLRIVVAEGLSTEVVQGTRQRVGEGVAGSVLLEGRARVLVDRLNDPRYRSGRERTAIKAAVSAPIRIGPRSIGVLNVSSDTRPNAFSEATMAQMEQFGAQVAEILLRAVEPDEQRGPVEASLRAEIESLMDLDQPLDRRLEAVLEKLAGAAQAGAGRLLLLDGTGQRLEKAAEFGPTAPRSMGAPPTMSTRGLIGQALATRQAEAYLGHIGSQGRRGVFIIPVMARELLGVIELEDLPVEGSNWTLVFTALQQVARHFALLLQEVQSRALLTRRTNQMLRFSDLSTEILELARPTALIDLALRAAGVLFESDLVVFRPTETDELVIDHPELVLEMNHARLPDLDAGLAELARSSGRAILADDARGLIRSRLRDEAGAFWAMSVPVGTPRLDLGVLSVYGLSALTPPPTEEDRALLDRLAAVLTRTSQRFAGQSGEQERFMHWPVFQERAIEEMKRADRYTRLLGLVTLEFERFRAVGEERGSFWIEAARFAVADFIMRHIREVDIPSWVRDGRVAVLCPEANDLSGAITSRLESAWAQYVGEVKMEGLTDLTLRVDEMIYPGDNRDWSRAIDWLADRFSEARAKGSSAA